MEASTTSDSLFTPAETQSVARSEDVERRRARLVQGAVRGAIASMAMTGLREFTRHAGLLEEPPPESILRQKRMDGLRRLRGIQHGPGRVQAELVHWTFGAAAGALFAVLPRAMRRSPWSGPLFGLAIWTGFELGIAPILSLSQAKRPRVLDRLTLVGDHLLYGYILSENATLRTGEIERSPG